jgi:Tol biopolymer transport system component
MRRSSALLILTITACQKISEPGTVIPSHLYFQADDAVIDGTSWIFALRLADTTVRQVTPDSLDARTPTVSPSGSQIAVRGRPVGSLWIMNADGSGIRRIPVPMLDIGRASWSSDATRLIIGANWVVPIDGSLPYQIGHFSFAAGNPAFGPDDRIAFVGSFSTGTRTDSTVLYVMNQDGTGLRQLTSGTQRRSVGDPVWSPTGEWIAFSAAGSSLKAVYIIRPDGTGERQAFDNAFSPAWSPDGRKLAFLRVMPWAAGPGPVRNQIFVGDLSGNADPLSSDGRNKWSIVWGRLP